MGSENDPVMENMPVENQPEDLATAIIGAWQGECEYFEMTDVSVREIQVFTDTQYAVLPMMFIKLQRLVIHLRTKAFSKPLS